MSGVALRDAGETAARRTRADYEDFLFREAELLDEWRLDEWLALFTDDAVYEVPVPGAPESADSHEALFLVADDRARLEHRVRRLNKPGAHSEWPRSHGVHSISNVRILADDGREATIRAVFITYRSKNDVTDCYFGHHLYRVRSGPEGLRIASKRSFLDMSSLRPQGRISIIV